MPKEKQAILVAKPIEIKAIVSGSNGYSFVMLIM
jgi:hypothetical protein